LLLQPINAVYKTVIATPDRKTLIMNFSIRDSEN
jgi:hypothetical protein